MIRFRKSKKMGAFRLTASKSGLTGSVGVGGFRFRLFGGRKSKKAESGGCLSTLTALFLMAVGGIVGLGFLLGGDNTVSPKQPPAVQIEPEPPESLAVVEAAPAVPERAVVAEPEPVGEPQSEPEIYREWTSANGKFSTVARLLDRNEAKALLMRREPWKTIAVPIAKLSKSDTDYIAADSQQLLVGKVISVADGDTFTLRDSENYKIRLEGIDAPEKGQDYGKQARKALSEAVFGKTVRVRWLKKDRYGRVLGQVIADGQWVNHQLVNDGWAWHFTEYSADSDLAEAERFARDAKRGLWADPNQPTAPWDYRDRPRQPPVPISNLIDSPKQPATLTHWLNTKSNVRHNAGCKFYKNTNQGRSCGAGDGKPCGICGG